MSGIDIKMSGEDRQTLWIRCLKYENATALQLLRAQFDEARDLLRRQMLYDLGGEYAVSFMMVLVAACLAGAWHALSLPRAWAAFAPLAPAALLLTATLVYGYWRLGQDVAPSGPRVALIQGNALAEWKADSNRAERIMREYTQLSVDAVRAAERAGDGRAADLVVWPETMFRSSIVKFQPGAEPAPYLRNMSIQEVERSGPQEIARLALLLDTPVLLGVDVMEFLASPPNGQRKYRAWNAAVLAGRDSDTLPARTSILVAPWTG